MTHPTRDPRHRRQQHTDPQAAAVRLTLAADAMRASMAAAGPQLEELHDLAGVLGSPPADPVTVLAAQLAEAAQLGVLEPPLTAQQFADALGPIEPVAESPEPPASVPPTPAAFSSERSTPRAAWSSRHDPRSLAYGIRPRLPGSVPMQDLLLPTGPVLDQAAAGTSLIEQSCCTGCGTVAAANTLQLERTAGGVVAQRGPLLDLEDAEQLYRRAQQLDGVPGENYPGTSVLAAMQAAVEQGRIGGYLWAFGTRDIAQAVLSGRPVVIGIPWLPGMWDTGPGGLVTVTGEDEGLGHCLAVNGITLKGPQGQPGPFFRWQNSAGESYGDGGFGFIHHRDLAGLLHGRGEAAIPTREPQAAA